MKTQGEEKLLSREEIRRIGRLSFLISRKMGGRDAGGQLSKRTGEGMEFTGYQDYQCGDDLRYLDWNLYARSDRLYLKRFSQEKELTIYILLDVSRSMSLGEPSKLAVARKVSAGLAYIALRRFYHAGLFFFSSGIKNAVPPLRGEKHLMTIFRSLQNVCVTDTTDLTRSLKEFAKRDLRNGLVILISDLFAPSGYEEGLLSLLYKGHSIGILHLLSSEDLSPSLEEGAYRLEDAETGEAFWIDEAVGPMAAYREHIDSYQEDLRTFCHRRGIYYSMTPATQPVEQILWDLLSGLRRIKRW